MAPLASSARPRIASFTSPQVDGAGLVRLRLGDALSLEVELDADADADADAELSDGDVVEVWTNADHVASPDEYRAVPMRRIGPGRYALDLAVTRVGNYRATARVRRAARGRPPPSAGSAPSEAGTPPPTSPATARYAAAERAERGTEPPPHGGGEPPALAKPELMSADDDVIWASESGIADLRFRPRDPAYDSLCIEEVSVAHVNWDPFLKRAGTFADLVDESSRYSLRGLAERGVNAIWLMPPFPVSLWPGRHPLDDAGSPYAVADYFSIRRELLREPDVSDDGIGELRRFLDAAHALGIRVILDVALNHVGHEHLLRDFVLPGRIPGHVVTLGTLEDVAPWMLANRHGDPRGCRGRDDKLMGGTFEWPDTAKLNTGRSRAWRYVFSDVDPPLPEHVAVRGWLQRVLQFWVHVGVDGFRFDHLCGLPPSMLEQELNRVQSFAQPKRLFLVGEDFHTHGTTLPFLDAGQGGWFRDFLAARTAKDFERILDDPWFKDLLTVSTHDEDRPVVKLGDDLRAWQRLASILLLAGGPVAFVAGDHLAERVPLPFKRWRGVAALREPSVAQRAVGDAIAHVARARLEVRALREGARAWLRSTAANDAVLAFAHRVPGEREVAVVVANLSNTTAQECVLDVDDHDLHVHVEPYEVQLAVLR